MIYLVYCSSDFLLTFNILMPDVILSCLNVNLSVSFRVWLRSPVTFKTKFYVTINTSVQQLPIFCHKVLRHRCCIKLEHCYMIHKNSKRYQGALSMIKCATLRIFFRETIWFYQAQLQKSANKIKFIILINGVLMIFFSEIAK